MSKGKVFVVQVPARRSGPGGDWVETYDIAPAEEFGEIVRLLPYGNLPKDQGSGLKLIRDGLVGFNAKSDHVLLLGDPVACAQAVLVLGHEFMIPYFNVLKWDRRDGRYYSYRLG